MYYCCSTYTCKYRSYSDLTPVIGASEIVGRNLTKGSIVVYESTVYPGCTEDVYSNS
ncbi:MAG: hypothetical protein ACLTMR_02825 [Faecalibacillus sp.]